MQTEKAWSWRVEHIPQGTTPEQLKSLFVEADQSRIVIESLVPESIAPDLFIHGHASHYLTATISFRAQRGCKPQLINGFEGKISLDADFYGFTSLYSSDKYYIAAESVNRQSYILKLICRLQCRSCDRRPRLWLLDAFSNIPSQADVAARLST